MKTYIEEFLTTFIGFHQTVFSFLTAYRLQQLFPQLTVHSNFFHSHSPTKQTLSLSIFFLLSPQSVLPTPDPFAEGSSHLLSPRGRARASPAA
jgi:hypothetical protein